MEFGDCRFPIADFEEILTTEDTKDAEAMTLHPYFHLSPAASAMSAVNDLKKVRDGEDTIASTRDARAPRNAQMESIRAVSSDFEARRLLRQSARHQRQRVPGTGPMLVPSLQRYQAYPLSKPGIDLCTPDFLSRSVRYQSISHRTDRTVLSGPNLTSHPSQ